MARNDDLNPEFDMEQIQRQQINVRKTMYLQEQNRANYRPGLIHNPNQQQYQNQQQQNKRFDPSLDTKMTFNNNGQILAVGGKDLEATQDARSQYIAGKLGMENSPEAIAGARNKLNAILKEKKNGVPCYLEMNNINEWVPSKEANKFLNKVDFGDEFGQTVTTQAKQLREYSERKWGKPEDTDALMNSLSSQQRQVAGSMISDLATGKARFLHEYNGHGQPPAQQAPQHAQPQPANIRDGAAIMAVLQAPDMGIPCRLARPVAAYNKLNHGTLFVTGKALKAFIVENVRARIDIGVIQANPQFVKDVVEVADARGQLFVVLREDLSQPMGMMGQGNNGKFLTDQKRMMPQPRPMNGPDQGSNSFQQFMQKKILKG
jgi:hypothetical protein